MTHKLLVRLNHSKQQSVLCNTAPSEMRIGELIEFKPTGFGKTVEATVDAMRDTAEGVVYSVSTFPN